MLKSQLSNKLSWSLSKPLCRQHNLALEITITKMFRERLTGDSWHEFQGSQHSHRSQCPQVKVRTHRGQDSVYTQTQASNKHGDTVFLCGIDTLTHTLSGFSQQTLSLTNNRTVFGLCSIMFKSMSENYFKKSRKSSCLRNWSQKSFLKMMKTLWLSKPFTMTPHFITTAFISIPSPPDYLVMWLVFRSRKYQKSVKSVHHEASSRSQQSKSKDIFFTMTKIMIGWLLFYQSANW